MFLAMWQRCSGTFASVINLIAGGSSSQSSLGWFAFRQRSFVVCVRSSGFGTRNHGCGQGDAGRECRRRPRRWPHVSHGDCQSQAPGARKWKDGVHVQRATACYSRHCIQRGLEDFLQGIPYHLGRSLCNGRVYDHIRNNQTAPSGWARESCCAVWWWYDRHICVNDNLCTFGCY